MSANTITAHGRQWPLHEIKLYDVAIRGVVESAIDDLRNVLERFGVSVEITPVTLMMLSDEDSAEKEALDQQVTQ